MNESSKLEERLNNRRQRRWRRRARIAAPFAALPLLFGMLMLSIDVIEYEPQPPRKARPYTPDVRSTPRYQPSLAARAALATPAVTTEQLLDESASGATDPSGNQLGDGRRDAAMAMPMMPDAPLEPSE